VPEINISARTVQPMPSPTELVIETTGLKKGYVTRHGRHMAINGLDLAVPRGGVHGYLGPNGSGKTTTIRMLLGLARADAGTMRLFGTEVPAGLPSVIHRVGAVVEQPRLFPAFTGRRNLELLGGVVGVSKHRIDEVLEVVGLTERAGDRYRAYSLGMRQRLAIAAAMLKSPDLLVLDEPTNGLDPAGIREIRDTVRDLGRSGVTVLLSSHLLAEVQQVCDSVSIIGHGRLLGGGRVDEVLRGSGPAALRVRVDEPVRAAEVLRTNGFAVEMGDDEVLLVRGAPEPALITKRLADAGLYLAELSPVESDLESFFLSVTEGEGL
jgi:ABC-2 type transport system ATP-binding protein